MGRKKIELDWKTVDNLFTYGATVPMVANILEVSIDTVERRIKQDKKMKPSEYREAKLDKVRVKLVQKAISKALDGDNTMLIFCLKNLCGWADKKELEHKANDVIKLAYNLEESVKKEKVVKS